MKIRYPASTSHWLLPASLLLLCLPHHAANAAAPVKPVGPVKPVEVVNDETMPVIVEGQVEVVAPVTIDDSTAIAVEVVNDDTTPASVIVENDNLSPVPVTIQDSESSEPVVLEVSVTESGLSGTQTVFTTDRYLICTGTVPTCDFQEGQYSVPPGKTLVIDQVAFRARTLFANPIPERCSATLEFGGQSGFGFSLPVGLLDEMNPELNIWGKSEPMSITVPPETHVRARITWSNFFDGNIEASMVVSGTLVTIP